MKEAIQSDSYVVQGEALDVLRRLPSGFVQCIVTSPPYWQLRDYGCEGQLGLEKTPGEYIGKMVDIFREAKRVLRSDGTLWVNIGDSFIHYGKSENFGGNPESMGRNRKNGNVYPTQKRYTKQDLEGTGLKEKDIVGIPWQLAFAMRDDGWYFRGDIIWHKSNIFPESVKDRPTRCHEYVFLFSKNERYHYDHRAVRERAVSKTNGTLRNRRSVWKMSTTVRSWSFCQGCQTLYEGSEQKQIKQMGKRRFCPKCGSAERWLDHFASFPPRLAKLCVLAGTSEGGACKSCGASRYFERGEWRPNCGCHAGFIPSVVLDPFAGSANSGLVARAKGRAFLGIDIKPEYVTLANARLKKLEQSIMDGGGNGNRSKEDTSSLCHSGFRHVPHGYGLLSETGTELVS